MYAHNFCPVTISQNLESSIYTKNLLGIYLPVIELLKIVKFARKDITSPEIQKLCLA